LLKESAKRKLAQVGNTKYAMHGPNEALRPTVLRDGSPVYEFTRCNPHWGGVSSCDQGRHIGDVLTGDMLNRLIKRGGTCILYTHLGKAVSPTSQFGQKTVEAFRLLAKEFHGGRILVTTTRRLLRYRRIVREIAYKSHWDGENLRINIGTRSTETSIDGLSANEFDGLTFYVRNPETTMMTIERKEITDFKRNPPDRTGWPSVSLVWPMLEFPSI